MLCFLNFLQLFWMPARQLLDPVTVNFISFLAISHVSLDYTTVGDEVMVYWMLFYFPSLLKLLHLMFESYLVFITCTLHALYTSLS